MTPGRSVRAVLFDLDNTLVLEDLATRRAFDQASAGASGHGVDPARLAAAAEAEAEDRWRGNPSFSWADGMGISAGEALWGSFAGPGSELEALRAFAPGYRQAAWEGALGRCAVTATARARLATDLAAAFVRARLASEPLDPDAEAILDELRTTYRLALVTNGAPAIQRTKLALTDLARRFEVIVVSGEVGAGKPNPRAVRVALERLGVGAHEAVLVGDSLERDVAAARAAGVYAIWLDREVAGTSGLLPSGADARIRSLRELPALLAALPPPPASPPGSRAPRPA